MVGCWCCYTYFFLTVWIYQIIIHSLNLKPFFSHFSCMLSVTRMHPSVLKNLLNLKVNQFYFAFSLWSLFCVELSITLSGHYRLLWASPWPQPNLVFAELIGTFCSSFFLYYYFSRCKFSFYYLSVEYLTFQSSSELSGGLVKTVAARPCFQSFWFISSGVGPRNFHY